MRKIVPLMFILLFLVFHYISPEEVSLVDENNAFGGRTILRTLSQEQQAVLNYVRLYEYYDVSGNIVRLIAIPTEDFSERTGLQFQMQHYRDDRLLAYEKGFTDWFLERHDFDRIIEDVDLSGHIISRSWYRDNILLDFTRNLDDLFEFYNIEYIERVIIDSDTSDHPGNVIWISSRYVRIKSIIRFDTELVDMNENDFLHMRYLQSALGVEGIEQYYTRKVRVFSENNSYWFYVQTTLEEFVLGQLAVIRYYPIGVNNDLYLIGIGFIDIDELNN